MRLPALRTCAHFLSAEKGTLGAACSLARKGSILFFSSTDDFAQPVESKPRGRKHSGPLEHWRTTRGYQVRYPLFDPQRPRQTGD